MYNKPSAAVHPGALAAGTLPQYNTITLLYYTTHETLITKTNKRASTNLLQKRYKTTSRSHGRRVRTCCAHLLCAPIRRIYRGVRRHHADMSVVVLITLSCRPRLLPGRKDCVKYQYHQYRHRGRHDFVSSCTPALSVTVSRVFVASR